MTECQGYEVLLSRGGSALRGSPPNLTTVTTPKQSVVVPAVHTAVHPSICIRIFVKRYQSTLYDSSADMSNR